MATPTTDSKESNATHEPAPPLETTKEHSGYYGYMFEKDKSPTRTLDALLRAIGQYIVSANPSPVSFGPDLIATTRSTKSVRRMRPS